MFNRFLISFIIVLLFHSCTKNSNAKKAQLIVDKAIDTANLNRLKNSVLEFDFRDKHYVAKRVEEEYSLTREFKNKQGKIIDVISNSGFNRYINNQMVELPDSLKIAYYESVNSVHYFSKLPFGLNDQAVNKEFLGEVEIDNKSYFKIKITFTKEGGGTDYEDVFIYWFDKESYKLGYLAYTFNINGGGIRFREVTKEMIIGGLRFVNYYNFKPKVSSKIENLDSLFIKKQLEKISEINLENIKLSSI